MFAVPVTFLAPFQGTNENSRQVLMREYAANGAKHLVLSAFLIDSILGSYSLAKRLDQEMKKAGLSFADAHAPYGGIIDLNCPDPDFRPQMLLRHKLGIRIAASLGVSTITIHPGSDRFFPEIPLEKHWDLMRDSLDQLIPEAESCGVTICIENTFSRAACPSTVVMLKKEYATDTIGLCYDSGHANLLENGRHHPGGKVWEYWKTVGVDEPEWDDQILEKMQPNIVNCHLHDNDGFDDLHNLPGDGCVNWAKVIPMLKQAPHLKVIQSEVRSGVSIREVCQKFTELGEI